MARVSTYLNFPGTTEVAFHFYRSVFGGEFIGNTMRMGDAPPHPGQPHMTEQQKNQILHIELAITGGHVIMATDFPEIMGQCKTGNNMHINLEPDTRAEARRLFEALSVGGTVGMPLQDMFWGALFGSFCDQHGVNWMINCQNSV